MAERFLATPVMRRAPIASTRACSTASNTARACCPPGTSFRCAELARRLGQTRLAADNAGALGGEGNLEVALAGNGAQAARDRALERLGRAVLGGVLAFDVGRHAQALQLSATFTDDSGNSTPKQR